MNDPIHILGAGLVGSLLGLQLAKRGFQVRIFEKRPDPERNNYGAGRSINLALSHRGIHALKTAGVFKKIEPILIPMHGRMIHDELGNQSHQPYGEDGQYINSVSRSELNLQLIREARQAGVRFSFDHECESIDVQNKTCSFSHFGKSLEEKYEVLFGADGAFSALRKQLELDKTSTTEIQEMAHGYKELAMAPKTGDFAMAPHHLHIWPRKNFMLIALPNPDRTFTCTLFFSKLGTVSFESLQSEKEIETFFKTYFADVVPLIPDYISQFRSNPTSSLVTVNTYPWTHNHTLLIGDASHAIVPFYGQGMNAGFEDVRLLMEMIDNKPNWVSLFDQFQATRKPNADAIAALAMYNFTEMRDKVADPRFQAQKRLEKKLHEQYPTKWTPLYSLVTFSDTPYSECLALGKLQQQVMDEIEDLNDPELDLVRIVDQLSALKQGDLRASQ